MAAIHLHRVARLMELSAAERTLKGPERLLREEDVAQLLRAAYDDASEKARAEFMARVNHLPAAAWPWSAVQASSPRGGGGILGLPVPTLTMPPAALILLMGQVDSPELDPVHRVPDRNTPEGTAWEPLYRALETWDTTTIKKWWHPVGWVVPGTPVPTPKDLDPGAGSGAPEGNDMAPAGSDAPAQPAPGTATAWTTPRVVLVAGVTVVATSIAVYSVVNLRRARELNRLSERLRAQELRR